MVNNGKLSVWFDSCYESMEYSHLRAVRSATRVRHAITLNAEETARCSFLTLNYLVAANAGSFFSNKRNYLSARQGWKFVPLPYSVLITRKYDFICKDLGIVEYDWRRL